MDAPHEAEVLVAAAALTMDDRQPFVAPARLSWHDGVLTEIRTATVEDLAQHGTRHLDDAVVLPGFVNAHHHVANAALTGIEDQSLPTLSGDRPQVRRHLAARLDEDVTYALASLGYLDLLRAGVTTTTDAQAVWRGDRRVDGSIAAATDSGLRVLFSAAFMNRTDLIPPDQQFDAAGAIIELERLRHEHAGPRVEVEGEPLALPRATDDLIRSLHEARRRIMTMHLTYSRSFAAWALEHLGRPAVEHLDLLGVLDAGWLFAHPLHLTTTEIELLGDAGARAAYCPVSNLHMGLEAVDLQPLRTAGIPLGLGLDHPNGSHDVLQNAKVAALVQRSAGSDAGVWTAMDSLTALTLDGARALGLEDEIGMLRPGHRADVVVLRGLGHQPRTLPGLAERIVMSGAREHVTDVLVDGRWGLYDGGVTRPDEDALRAQAAAAQDRLGAPDA